MPPIQESRPSIGIRVANPTDVFRRHPRRERGICNRDFLDGARTDEARMAEMMKKGEFLVAVGGSTASMPRRRMSAAGRKRISDAAS